MTAKEKLAETNYASLAEMMTAYADEAVRVAWNEHRQRLDFSESSVDVLEQILDGQAAADLEFQTRLWGGYFGEVIRRRFPAEWELAPHPGGKRRCGTRSSDRCVAPLSAHQGVPPSHDGCGRERV